MTIITQYSPNMVFFPNFTLYYCYTPTIYLLVLHIVVINIYLETFILIDLNYLETCCHYSEQLSLVHVTVAITRSYVLRYTGKNTFITMYTLLILRIC